jgi:ankyrin repeat protein/membrane protein involved in colicin uptake
MALNINNTPTGPLVDPLKLVKITQDNISDYPGLDAKFIGYNLFANEIRDIAAEYQVKRVLKGLVDATTGLPSPAKIYEQIQKDVGRSNMIINTIQLKKAFDEMYKLNKQMLDELTESKTIDEFREKVAKLFPNISLLDDRSQMEAIYAIVEEDAKAKADAEAKAKAKNEARVNNDKEEDNVMPISVIPFIYSIYNRFGIRDNEKILQYMAFMQQGGAGSITTDLVFPMYSIEPRDNKYVGMITTSNGAPEAKKINMGDFSGKPLNGVLNVIETIEEGKMNAIEINVQLFTSYTNISGDAYILFANNTITYVAYSVDKVYFLIETIWRNESVHKGYDLIKQIDTSAEINQRIMGYIYETMFKEYLNPQIQPTLVNIFDLLLKISDLAKRAEIFGKLESIIDKILASPSIFIPGKLQYLYSALFDAGSIDTILNAESVAQIEAKLKEFDTCDDADIDSSCKANERLLPNEPTFFNQVTQKATDVYNGRITPMSKDKAIELGNSAVIWAIKAYDWSKKDSIAGAQGAREQIEAIISKLDASAKQYKEDMDRDTSLYKTYNPIYEQIVAISKEANIALNFATAVVIIDTLRQQPEGIGGNVKVVNSLVISTLNDIKKMQGIPEDDVDGVEEEKVADEQEVNNGVVDQPVADEAVEDEKTADVPPTQPVVVPDLDPMCNNKQKWEEYYKVARPVVEHSIEPDDAWQTEQQSDAKCGHHSLHNLFHNVWTKTECPPKNISADNRYKEDVEADAEELSQIKSLKEYNDKLRDVLKDYNENQPIDLYKLCRINRRFQLLDRGSRLQMDDCREEGNYSPVIIRNALNIAGYPTFEINNNYDTKYSTEEYCKFIIDQFQSGNNLIGMILITGKQANQVGHFIEVRKNNDAEIEVVDTLYKQNPGSQAESSTLKLDLKGVQDVLALATQLNNWIEQAIYKEIYGVIGVFPFSGKYIPARIDQYFDLTPFNEEYEAKTGHNERYTDEAGDIFQKKDTPRPNQPNPKTDLIDTCKGDDVANRNFSVETTEVDYVPIYMEDVAVKRGGWGHSKKQRGGANPDITKVESSVKDLYDIAMMLLNLNGELIEKSEGLPSEQSDKSNLTNTLTILLNTRIPGKRNLLYKPQMTIPNITSSQVWFDPRIKLKQSIVNKPQPVLPALPQSPRVAQNRYQMPSGYQQYNQSYNNSQVQYGGGETPNERKEIYTQFFNRNEFNNLLLRTMNESPQQIPDLTTAKEEGITDNNIQVTLDTLFKSDNVIYIEGAPYTIYAHDWIIGDWQIDTRPNIYIDSRTQFQVQAPTYTSYGVIIPKTSNIAIFEEQAKKERSQIPIALQKGDALEMSSKINKAIKGVLSQVVQNTKPRLTSAEIMKKASPWELAKLVERQMANRAYQPPRYESPNYVNVEPASVAANVRVADVEKAKARVEANAKAEEDAKAKAEADAGAKAEVDAKAAADAKAEADAKAAAVAEAKAEAVEAKNALKNVNTAVEEAKTTLATLKENESVIPPDDIIKAENKVEEMENKVEDAKEEVEVKQTEFIEVVNGKLPKDILIMMVENYLQDINKVVERNPIEKLRHNFLSSLREAGIKSIWNITSIRNLFNLDKDNKIIDANNSIKPQTINQINEWQMLTPEKDGNNTELYNLYQAIAVILKNFLNTPITANFIETQLEGANISTETDQIIKYIEEIYKIKLVIIVAPDQNAVKPQKFELNQRVSFTITPLDIATNKALRVRKRDNPKDKKSYMDFKSTMYGVVVKENPDNTYNILTDDYIIMENIPYNVIKLSIKYMIYNPVESLEQAIPTNIQNLKQCAFLLYNKANYEGPYSVLYRSKGKGQYQYIFKLDDLPSYLYYMIFLASYKFEAPAENEPIGKFVVNQDSTYPKIKSLMTNTRVKGMYDIYNNILKSTPYYVAVKDDADIKDKGVPIKQRIMFGGGPQDDLVRAIETNNIDDIKTLLNEDASLINKTNANGNTMLMIACQNKNLSIVKTLLEMGAQGTINKQNVIGDTALHISCKNGYAVIASVLVLNGADLTIKNVLGKTPIEVCEDPALKAQLELHKANVKKMFEFVKNNRTQDLQKLLKTFRDVNLVDLTTGDTPLHIACKLGKKDIALLLLQCGANPTLKNNNGQTPFDLVENETLKTNLQDQYNLTQTLFDAVENDSLPEIEQILDRLPANQVSIIVNSRTNPESTEQGETPLHIAVKTGNKEMVKFLLDYGADVNAGDKYEATPLHFACRNGDGYIARMLVEFGGDLTIKAIDGRTPLDACKTNELRIDLIKDYIEKLARDNKLNLPKGSRLNDEASIKKALEYYLKKPNKVESKNSYYVVMDLDLYPGTSISTAQKARMQCSRVWDNIQEAWADSRGADYVPKEQDISKVPVATEVPLAEAKPIRGERTRRRYGGKKCGSTRRCSKQNKCRGPTTRKHKHIKHKYNSRRVKK